jgi:hypothetical protein
VCELAGWHPASTASPPSTSNHDINKARIISSSEL